MSRTASSTLDAFIGGSFKSGITYSSHFHYLQRACDDPLGSNAEVLIQLSRWGGFTERRTL